MVSIRRRLTYVYFGMKARCYNPFTESYSRYGKRGIKVCAEWLESFEAFYQWALANNYKHGLILDRKDNDGNYTPDNCQFVTRFESMRNTKSNNMITAFGETKSLVEWTEDPRCNAGRQAIRKRIRLGWKPETAISAPKYSIYNNPEGSSPWQ